jgi:hypothetical protein
MQPARQLTTFNVKVAVPRLGPPATRASAPVPAAPTAPAAGSVCTAVEERFNGLGPPESTTSQGVPGMGSATAMTGPGQATHLVATGRSGSPAAEGAGASATAWFRALVLDCDGVLVDSERASCEALRQAILQVGSVAVAVKGHALTTIFAGHKRAK